MNNQLNKAITSVTKQLNKAMDDGVQQVGATLKQQMIDYIDTATPSGVQYGDHKASAPGEAPAINTGVLKKSITINHTNKKKIDTLTVRARDYGLYLEYGTSKMAPRPFIIPSVEQVKQMVEQIYQNEVEKIK